MRITGGTLRSRAIRAPRGQATRPTSDRVREALFGILESAGRIDGARVLDLYAGTGALGIEAVSRGASAATLVESGREALEAARANVASLGVAERVHVLASDVTSALPRLGRHGPFASRQDKLGAAQTSGSAAPFRFDLVLVDPPWALVDEGKVTTLLAALVTSGALAADALLVLEHSSRTPPPEVAGLTQSDTRRYGDATLTFYAILPPPRP